MNLAEGVSAQMRDIQWFSASGRVGSDVDGSFRAEASDDSAAATLRGVLGAYLEMARQQVASKPEIRALIESLELGGTGKTVALSFRIPSELFDSLAERRRQPTEQSVPAVE